MRWKHRMNSLDRRAFLAAGTAAMIAAPTRGYAQMATTAESPRLSARIADYLVGYDLKSAPPLASTARSYAMNARAMGPGAGSRATSPAVTRRSSLSRENARSCNWWWKEAAQRKSPWRWA